MKKYNLRCNYCGHDHYVWDWWLRFKLITFGEVRRQCPECSQLTRYRLIGHIAHDGDKKEKEYNKEVNSKKPVWVK